MTEETAISSRHQPDWVTVLITYSFHEAHIIAGRLLAEGIHALVYQEPGASAMGIHIGRLGEIKVLVRPEYEALALSILFPDPPPRLSSDHDQIVFDLDDDEDEE